MATKTKSPEFRSKVAEACLDFGAHLLRVRLSSVSSNDAQDAVKELFDWFASNNAFDPANAGIAIHAIDFGKDLLETRKTATVQEAVDAVQTLYSSLMES